MTTMLLISVMLTAGLLKENQPVQMPVQVSFPSGNISVLTAQADEGWLEVDRTWLIPREGEEPLRVRAVRDLAAGGDPGGNAAASLGLSMRLPSWRKGRNCRASMRATPPWIIRRRRYLPRHGWQCVPKGTTGGRRALGFSWELPQMTRTQEGEAE